MYVTPDETQPVLTDQLQRGYEVTPGRFAVVRSEELRRLRQPTSTEMQILRSVRMEEIDPVFLETSYYVHPGPGADHSYGLFFRALKESSYAALAEVAMHGRQHVIVIRAGTTGLIAHTMFYVNEVRKGEEHVTIATDVPAKELDLAKQFVEAIAASFKPEEFTATSLDQLPECHRRSSSRCGAKFAHFGQCQICDLSRIPVEAHKSRIVLRDDPPVACFPDVGLDHPIPMAHCGFQRAWAVLREARLHNASSMRNPLDRWWRGHGS
jgi:Ku protein